MLWSCGVGVITHVSDTWDRRFDSGQDLSEFLFLYHNYDYWSPVSLHRWDGVSIVCMRPIHLLAETRVVFFFISQIPTSCVFSQK